jgi:hypothetical protein
VLLFYFLITILKTVSCLLHIQVDLCEMVQRETGQILRENLGKTEQISLEDQKTKFAEAIRHLQCPMVRGLQCSIFSIQHLTSGPLGLQDKTGWGSRP